MLRIVMAATAASLALGGAAAAQDKCFDKGTLRYIDCPQAQEPAPLLPPPPPQTAVLDESGFYLGLRGGYVYPEDADYDFFDAGGALVVGGAVENEFDAGWTVSGVIGYEFHRVADRVSLRPELELGYQTVDFDTASSLGTSLPAEGEVDIFFAMANLYADIAIANRLDLILGGGLGYGNVDISDYATQGGANPLVDDSDGVFGYHLDAGLGYDLTRQVTIEALYRYASYIDAEVGSLAAPAVTVEADDHSYHQGLVGLRYKF